MDIENILVISPPSYTHSQCFFDVALAFQAAFKEIGKEVEVFTNPDQCSEGKTLVLGAHLISKYEGTIDGNYVIYQTEQVEANESLFVDDKYLDILRRFPVFDYSINNISWLGSKGINAIHLPIGYNRCMSNIKTGKSPSMVGGGRNGRQRIETAAWSGVYPPTDHNGRFVQDVDICFIGSMNERRSAILDELKKIEIDGKPLTVVNFIGYGGFRDKVIARSKIVLNMHYYDSSIFEIFRCSHLFANKKCVISELGKDNQLESKYRHAGGFVTYNRLVDKCAAVLKDDNAREGIAKDGYEIFKQDSQAEIFKKIFGI